MGIRPLVRKELKMKALLIAMQILGLAAIVAGFVLIWLPLGLMAAGIALCFVAERAELTND
jgi:hypothetical protein